MYKTDQNERDILLNAISTGVDETVALFDENTKWLLDDIENESGGTPEGLSKAYHIGRITAHIERLMSEWQYKTVFEDFPAAEVLQEIQGEDKPEERLFEIVKGYIGRAFRCGYYKALEDKWGEAKPTGKAAQ